MQAKPEYRDRDETEVAVLDALADRAEDGMTVFELRSHVDEDINSLEGALEELKSDDLITVDNGGERTVIVPEDHAIGPAETEDEDPGIVDKLRRRLPF